MGGSSERVLQFASAFLIALVRSGKSIHSHGPSFAEEQR